MGHHRDWSGRSRLPWSCALAACLLSQGCGAATSAGDPSVADTGDGGGVAIGGGGDEPGGPGGGGPAGDDAAGADPGDDRVRLLSGSVEEVERDCADFATRICEKLRGCSFGAFFDMASCTWNEARWCHAEYGLPGVALDAAGLDACAERLTADDCVVFGGRARRLGGGLEPWQVGHMGLCAAGFGTLDNGEVCVVSAQCASGRCDAFEDADGERCQRCIADYRRARTVPDAADPIAAEGSEVTGSSCNNPLLEPVDGLCQLRPQQELDGTCGCPDTVCCVEPAAVGEPCMVGFNDSVPSTPCEPGITCAPDGQIGDLGFTGTCTMPEAFGDTPTFPDYTGHHTSRRCFETPLGPEDRVFVGTPPLGDACVPEIENDPSYLGARVDQTLVGRAFSNQMCVAHRFQGRVSCPYGQDAAGGGCMTASGPVQGPVAPQLSERRSGDQTEPPSVYDSCRCDGDDPTDRYCICPEGFSCVRVTESLGASGWASFCLHDGTEALDPAVLATGPVCVEGEVDCD